MENKKCKTNEAGKAKYLAPCIEVIEVENEGGVMSASAPGFGDGGGMTSSATSTRSRSAGSSVHQTASPLRDLEDLINDILTVKK